MLGEELLLGECFVCSSILNQNVNEPQEKCKREHFDSFVNYLEECNFEKRVLQSWLASFRNNGQKELKTCISCFETAENVRRASNAIEKLKKKLDKLYQLLTEKIIKGGTFAQNKSSKEADENTKSFQNVEGGGTLVEVVDIFEPKIEYLHSFDDDFFEDSENEQLDSLTLNTQDGKCVLIKANTDENIASISEKEKRLKATLPFEIRIILEKLVINPDGTVQKPKTSQKSLRKRKPKSTRKNIILECDDNSRDLDTGENTRGEESGSDYDTKYDSKRKLKTRIVSKKRKRLATPKLKNTKTNKTLGRPPRKLYSCEICGDNLKPMRLRLFRIHIKIHPDYKPFACKFTGCQMKFRVSYSLVMHEKFHSAPEESSICNICDRKCKGPFELRKHLQRVHVVANQWCTICQKGFKSRHFLMKHLKGVHKTSKPVDNEETFVTQFFCDICEQYFSSEGTFKTHSEKFHNEPIEDLYCEFCKATVTPLRRLNFASTKDKIIHLVKNSFKCRKCSQSFNCTEQYKAHLKGHYNEFKLKYKCRACREEFTAEDKYREHCKQHRAELEKNFLCEICSKGFYDKKNLVRHSLSHEENKQTFKCEYPDCGKVYQLVDSLRKHQEGHNKNNTYVCETCGESFFRKDYLHIHKFRKHTPK